jgi:hypothetical protein
MGPLPLIAAAAGLVVIVVFVFAPLVRPRPAGAPPATDDELQLLERRERALGALRELEFDHRTGKITSDDYTALLGRLRAEAAAAVQAAAAAGATQ